MPNTMITYSNEQIYCTLVDGILTIDSNSLLTNAERCVIPNLTQIWEELDPVTVSKVIIRDAGIHTFVIGANAFSDFVCMTSITLSKSITSINDGAFNISRDNLTTVYFNGKLQDWCNINFASETANPMFKAEHLYLKNTSGELDLLTELDLTNINFVNDTIPEYRLIGLSDITKLKLPNTNFCIDNHAFCGCTSLEIVDIPRACTSIGEQAFRDCTNLKHVYISKNEISSTKVDDETIYQTKPQLGSSVFLNCHNIKIHFEGNLADFKARSDLWARDWNRYNGPVTVAIPAKDIICNINSYAYKFTGTTDSGLCWGHDYNDEISITGYNTELLYKEPELEPGENTVSNNWVAYAVGKDSFNRDIYEYFLQVIIPEKINGFNVTKITKYAFSDCYKASIIVIPENITIIEDFAFYRCGNIRSFEVDSNNESFTTMTVSAAQNYVITPKYLVSKDTKRLVRYCTGNTEQTFTIPDAITEIGIGAFESSLDLVYLILAADKCTLFKRDAFYDCTNLKSVQFTGQWSRWAQITFENKEANPAFYSKRLISLSDLVTEGDTNEAENKITASINAPIKSFAFAGVKRLYNTWRDKTGKVVQTSEQAITKIVLNADCTTIGKYAFANCFSCQFLTLSSGLTSIAEHAFEGCSKLLTIYYGGTFNDWCKISFANEFSNPYYYDITRAYSSNQLVLTYNKNIYSSNNNAPVAWLSSSNEIVAANTSITSGPPIIPDCTFINSKATFSSSINIFTVNSSSSNNTLTIFSSSTNSHIGKHAFENVSFSNDINILNIPKGQSIGYCAFRGTNIPSLTIDAADISIDDYAFANLKAYGTLNITTNAANLQLGDNCFLGANYSKIKTLAKYLYTIDLSNCTDLTIIADGTEGVKDLFGGASKLQKLTIEGTSDSLTELLDTLTSETFKYCPNLAELQVNKIKDRRIFKKFFTDQNCLFKRDGDNNILVLGCNGFANAAERTVDNIPNVIVADRAFAYRKFGTTAGGNITEQLPALPKETISIGREIFYNVTVNDSTSSTSNSQ